jgi:hypothetical protein
LLIARDNAKRTSPRSQSWLWLPRQKLNPLEPETYEYVFNIEDFIKMKFAAIKEKCKNSTEEVQFIFDVIRAYIYKQDGVSASATFEGVPTITHIFRLSNANTAVGLSTILNNLLRFICLSDKTYRDHQSFLSAEVTLDLIARCVRPYREGMVLAQDHYKDPHSKIILEDVDYMKKLITDAKLHEEIIVEYVQLGRCKGKQKQFRSRLFNLATSRASLLGNGFELMGSKVLVWTVDSNGRKTHVRLDPTKLDVKTKRSLALGVYYAKRILGYRGTTIPPTLHEQVALLSNKRKAEDDDGKHVSARVALLYV